LLTVPPSRLRRIGLKVTPSRLRHLGGWVLPSGTMQYRQLGTTGTQVSVLCLGAMTFGEADEKSFMHKVSSSEDESFAVLDRAFAAGINFVDTADVYGQDGLSERVLGKWLAARKTRDKIVLASKGRFRMSEGPNGTGASRMRITRAIDASLVRLGTDRIDLYQIHMQDHRTGEEELLRALDDAVRAGKIVYIGCSNYAAYRLVESLWTADKRNLSRYVTLQAQYSLSSRSLEREHLPLCVRHGIGILPWAPLAGGLLTGKYRRNQEPPAGSRMDKWRDRYKSFDNDRNWNIVDTLFSDLQGDQPPREPDRARVAHEPSSGLLGDFRRAHRGAARGKSRRGRSHAVRQGHRGPRHGERLRARLPLRVHQEHRRQVVS
jgi:aryl-alcohol dehydrogenase-like predicted oxidoreductase